MSCYVRRKRVSFLYRVVSAFIAITFLFTSVLSPSYAQAVFPAWLNLPVPGTMVPLSPAFVPVLLKGMTIHPEDPLKFDFIIDSGNTDFTDEERWRRSKFCRRIIFFLSFCQGFSRAALMLSIA